MDMKIIRIEKVVCNIGCGTHTHVENAKKVLDALSGKKSVIIKTYKRNTFGVPKNKPIGCKVTVRKGSEAFFKRMIDANEGKLKQANFDNHGNFAFGIKEYIDIPGMEYEPKIGILGMDVCVALERPGYSVKRRRHPDKIGKKHVITKEEAIKFVKDKFNVKVE